MMNKPSFLLRANYAEPFDEGLAQIMALMLYRPEIGTELFGLTPEQARLVAETHRLREMFDLRNTMADSLFEFEAYADPDQDLVRLYNRIHSRYLGVKMHDTAVWAFNPLYGSDPIYLQSYVVGEMVARQILHNLDQRFGTEWGKQAGNYLQKKFYSRGAEQTLDELMQSGTGESLSTRYLIEHLHASRSAQLSSSHAVTVRQYGISHTLKKNISPCPIYFVAFSRMDRADRGLRPLPCTYSRLIAVDNRSAANSTTVRDGYAVIGALHTGPW